MEKLGINGMLLLAQIVNFFIIMAVLTKFLYKPIISFIKKRQQEIEEGFALKAKMEKEKEKLVAEKQAVLKKARSEAREIMKNAENEAQKKHDHLIAKAKEEITKMRKETQQQQKLDQQRLENDMSKQSVALAERMVAQLLSEVLSKKEQSALITAQLTKLEKAYRKRN